MARREVFGTSRNGGKRRTASAPSHEEVAQVAYELFLQRGCEHGHDGEDWLTAERIVQERRRAGLSEVSTLI
jgi:hypothetical protein